MSNRSLGQLCIALCTLSTVFPIVAGILNSASPPRWLGIVDVTVAALFFGSAAWVASRTRDRVVDRDRAAAFRLSQWWMAAIPALLGWYLIAGPRVNWTVLVIGVAWRAWLLHYTSPFLAASLDYAEHPHEES